MTQAARKPVLFPKAQETRDKMREAKICINGSSTGKPSRLGIVHGPVVKAGKCQRCIDVWRNGRKR